MSYETCFVNLKMIGKLPNAEIREDAAQYEEQGMPREAALQKATEERLTMARAQLRAITVAVRSAWEAQGGKPRPVPAPADTAPAIDTAPTARPQAPPARDPAPMADLNDMFVELLAEEAAAKPASDDLNGMFGELLAEVSGVDPRPTVAKAAPKKKASTKAKATKAAAAARAMTFEGRAVDGKPLMPGDVFATASGRTTTPFPKQAGQKYASQWLIDNATAEAEARGDTFNAPVFRATTMLKGGVLTSSDGDSLNEYLFGQQPAVVPKMTKPLAPKARAGQDPQTFIRKYAKTTDQLKQADVRKALFDAGQLANDVAGIIGEQAHLVTAVGEAMESLGYKFTGFDGLRPTFSKPVSDAEANAAAEARGAGEAAASAAKNTAVGLASAVAGLGEIFGANIDNKMGIVDLDETKYQRAVPFFVAAVESFKNAAVDIRDVMRAVIKAVHAKFGHETTANMQPYIVRFVEDYRAGKHQGENNAADGTAGSTQGDQEYGADGDTAAGRDLFNVDAAGAGGQTRAAGAEPDAAGAGSSDSAGVSGRDAAIDRAPGDQRLRAPESGSDGSTTESRDSARSGKRGSAGARPDAGASGRTGNPVTARPEQGSKLAEQAKAAAVPVKLGDRANIDATLPYLLEGQRADVAFAEARFADANAMPGVLFTNGTGTGKTFSGLGIIARQIRAGKTEGMILVPNNQIALDWIESGKRLGVDIKMLDSTSDNGGKGATITTYANFGDNATLADRDYDWLMADESHYLMSSKDGDNTLALATFRALTRHPQGFASYSRMKNRELYAKVATVTNKESDEAKAIFARIRKTEEKQLEQYSAVANTPAKRPKAIFLSATPFAYVKSVDYAEGYLFSYGQGGRIGNSDQDGRAHFFVQHFGYRIRYHKLTEPDGNVDVGLMARQFNSYLKKTGALSGRMLEVEADYGRRFVMVESALGTKIDEGMEFMRENPKYKHLYAPFMKEFTYLKRRYLLEAIKAREALPLIQQHLDMGRKVAIIHDYKKGGASNPFLMAGINGKQVVYDDNMKPSEVDLAELVEQFKAERPDLARLEIPRTSALQTLTSAFPTALIHNGDVPAKQLEANKRLFNADNNGRNIIILQSDKGREGISLHDTTGVHQRVEVIVGMAAKPTALIQLEGRIYRTGQVSDAAFDYVMTGTMWERWTFAQTIAERADIAEALAMGDDARALKDAIVEAFENAGPHTVSESDGKGGKARDRQAAKMLTDWDRARSFYYGQLKRTSSSKSAEGKDYFATPEPVGLKMVEWADIRPGEDVLEPSAGHGAIARWFPVLSNKTINEVETELITRTRLVVDGGARFLQGRFEDINIVNKYDAIVMNPPFGLGGSMAIPHLAKAYQHLRTGGRIVALLPRGPAADAKLEKFLYGENAPQDLYMVADINLPQSTFARAGAGVMTHVVILDKISDPAKAPHQVNRDFVSADDIDELFERIENTTVPGRVKNDQPIEIAIEEQKAAPKKQPREAAADATGAERYYAQFEFKHTKTGEQLYGAAMLNRTSMDTYKEAAAIAKQHGGYYNKFVGGGALRGFLFKSDEDRAAFMAEAGQLAEVSEGLDEQNSRTVEVDGKRRAITNSDGRPVGQGFGEQVNFWQWFGDSKVVDDSGRPLPMYHGTRQSFPAFDKGESGNGSEHATADFGFFFSGDPRVAGIFTLDESNLDSTDLNPPANAYSEGANLMPVYLAIKNPYTISADEFIEMADSYTGKQVRALRERVQKMGHDGILIQKADEYLNAELVADTWIAFESEQIKSATGNAGTFDPANPDILASRMPDESNADAVLRMYSEGVAQVRIAETLGINPGTVSTHLSKAGITRRPKGFGDDIKQKAVELYQSGLTAPQVGMQLGINRATVQNYLKDAGVPARREKRIPISDAVRDEAARLYVEKEMSAAEVATALGIHKATVVELVRERGLSRTVSEGRALHIEKFGRQSVRGKSMPWQSEKTGEWSFADSGYEIVRMAQLDADPNVLYWGRARFRIPMPDGKTYVPDLIVEYQDGRREVEEIKALWQLENETVIEKAEVAKAYFADMGIGYRIVTEDDIGKDNIDSFDFDALPLLADETKEQVKKDREAERRAERREEINTKARGRYAARKADIAAINAPPDDAQFSKFDPARRQLLAVAAAAAMGDASAGDVKLGKAKAISAAVLDQRVSKPVERILRRDTMGDTQLASGQTSMKGAQQLREAMKAISLTGPKELRALAAQVAKLLPADGVMLTVDDRRRMNVHGVVELSPMVHMSLFTAEGRTGLTYGTLIHEALHVAVAARYRSLSIGMVRDNDAILGLSAPAAAKALEQFEKVWDEFRTATAGEKFANRDIELAVTEARGNPDEFFVRALTDPLLQTYMAGKRYEGKTLWARFKDWIKTGLFGWSESGTAPSWLDAALMASDTLAKSMGGDKADFSRMAAIRRNQAGRSSSADSDTMASRRALPTPTWVMPADTKVDRLRFTLQDKNIDMKQTVAAVRDAIGDLGDKWDPYLQEELFHGRSATSFKSFLTDELRPLLTDMQARGVTMEQLEEYLHMRHAEEANARLADINAGNPDGLAGVSTKDAKDYLANLSPAQLTKFTALAARVDAIIKGTQQQLVEYGLEEQNTVDAWNGAYKHYVPLHREDMDMGKGNGTGAGYSVRGSATQARTGSKRTVVDILANVAMAREKTIVRGEKNRIAMALYGLALQSPNPGFWKPVNPQKNRAALESELDDIGLTPAEIAGIIDEPKSKRINKQTGLVESYVRINDRNLPTVVAVRINGADRFLFFSQHNERARRMAAAIKNVNEDHLDGFMGVVGAGTRYFASVNTQYNPIFGAVNLVRDLGEGSINLSSTAIAGKQPEVLAEAGLLLAKIVKGRGRMSSLSGADAALWAEFQSEGGITGYRAMFARSEDRRKELASELGRLTSNPAMKAGHAVFDWLSDYNEALENITRLAAYKVAKAEGLTTQRAASLAKNLTVNFNRKGAKTRYIGALFAFFNAAVQGTSRMAETMTGPAGTKILAGGILLGVLQALMLAMAGFDDEDIPEFIRAKNLIIPASLFDGDKDYYTVPLPLGFSFLPSIGRIGTEFALGGMKQPGRHGTRLLAVLLDTFNPLDSSTALQMISPTVTDPIAALSENKDFTGRDIAREDYNRLKPTPGHTRAKETASAVGKGLSWFFNAATGGTDYSPGSFSPTPDQVDYLIGQFTGGVGRELMKAQQSTTALFTGEEISMNKVPLAGRFYSDANDKSSVSTKFYENVKQLAEHNAEITGRREDRLDTKEYRADHPEAAKAAKAEAVLRDIADLRKRRAHWLEKGDKVRVKEFELKIRTRMQKFNDEVEEARSTAP